MTLVTIQDQIDYLLAHGWRQRIRKNGSASGTEWVSPAGGIYRGPHGAYKAAAAAVEADRGDEVRTSA